MSKEMFFWRADELEVDLSSPKYKLVLFDFHGTIVDRQLWSLRGLHRTWLELFDSAAPKSAYHGLLSRNNMSIREYLTIVLEEDKNITTDAKLNAKDSLSKKSSAVGGTLTPLM